MLRYRMLRYSKKKMLRYRNFWNELQRFNIHDRRTLSLGRNLNKD